MIYSVNVHKCIIWALMFNVSKLVFTFSQRGKGTKVILHSLVVLCHLKAVFKGEKTKGHLSI